MLPLDYQPITLSPSSKWTVASVTLDSMSSSFQKAQQQAKIKSQFTMDASQSGARRSPEFKYQRQLMGMLAEIAVESYLNETIHEAAPNMYKVVRYDDVRTDGFKSPENEYDIRIHRAIDGKIFNVESRSSMSADRTLEKGLVSLNVIGRYSSVAKSGELYSDFYFLPLFNYVDFNISKYSVLDFENLVKKGKVKLNLVAACLKEEMRLKGNSNSLNQPGTLYQVLQILNAHDLAKFRAVLINAIA